MKRRANKVKKVNYLELIPLHSEKIKSTVDSEGNITILIENKGIFYWITQKLLKKPRVSQIHLDKMGNFIWPLMDGEHDIMKIAEMVKEEFGEEAEPLYNRLVAYISTMEQYGFVEHKNEEEK